MTDLVKTSVVYMCFNRSINTLYTLLQGVKFKIHIKT